jgi:hypothetical protein
MKLGPQHLPAPSRRHDHGACADLTTRLLAQTGTVAEPDGTPAPVETFPRWGQTPTAAASTGAEPAVTPPSTAPQRPAEPAVTPPSTAPQRPATAPPATPDPTPDPTPARASASAETWLAEALRDGPRTAAELKDAANAAYISQRTLYRAAQKLSVVRDRVGGNRALWHLPKPATEPGADELRDDDPANRASAGPQDAPSAAQEARSAAGSADDHHGHRHDAAGAWPDRAAGPGEHPDDIADASTGGRGDPAAFLRALSALNDRAALREALAALELAGEALSRAARLVRHYLPDMEGTP